MSEVAQAPHSSPDGHIPQLRFPEFSGEWDIHSIGKIGTFFSGGTPTSSNKDYYSGTIPFIGSGKISSESVEQYITQEALDSSSAKIVNKGDLLYALYGATSGAVALSKINGAINQAVLCIRTDEDKFFIKTWLEKNKERILETYLQGGQGNLSAQIVKLLKINLPTKPEQQKIAAFLTAVDNKIQQLSKKQELLGEYKKGLMQKIFAQEIRFSPKGTSSQAQGEIDDGSEFPEWEEKKLGDALTTVSTRPFQIKSANVLEAGTYRGVDQGKKRVAGYSDERDKVYTDGEIIVYGDHTTIVKYIDFDFIIGADGTKLLTASKSNNLKYMYYNLLHNNIKAEGYKRHFSILKSILLQIPSLEEQTKIANFLSSIDSKIEQVSEQLGKSKQFKKALLQQMFV